MQNGSQEYDEFEVIEQVILETLEKDGLTIPIQNLGEGHFQFGTKKIFAKIMNEQIVIKVGSGYMQVEEFI